MLAAIRRHFDAHYAAGESPLDLSLQALLPPALAAPETAALRSSAFLTPAGWRRLCGMAAQASVMQGCVSPVRLLDAGCGRGGVGAALASSIGASLVGVDFSEAAIAAARADRHQPGAAFMVADIASLPFEDGAFAIACTIDALHLVPDPQLALRELRRVLRRGGVMFGGVHRIGTSGAEARHMAHWQAFFADAGFGNQCWQDVSQEWRSVMHEKHARRLAQRGVLVARHGAAAALECDVSRQMVGSLDEPGFISRNARFEFLVTAT